jgi:hypothetical protein
MGVCDLIELIFDGLYHHRMAMPQARNRCPARSVDIAFVILVEEFDSLATHGEIELLFGVAMENV